MIAIKFQKSQFAKINAQIVWHHAKQSLSHQVASK